MKLILALCIFLLFIHGFILFHQPLVSWDEAVYLGIGKYLYSGGQSGLYESFRPNLFPLLTGLGWSMSFDSVFFGRSIGVVFSVGCVFLVYLIGKHFFPQRIALLSSAFLAFTPVFFLHSTAILTGIMSAFFALLGLYSYLRERYLFTAFFCGISAATRFPAGVFFIIFLILSLRKVNFFRLAEICILFVIPFFPFFLVNYLLGYGIIQPLLDALFHQNYLLFAQEQWFYFPFLFSQSLFLLFALPGIYFAIKKKHYALLLCSLMPLLYFTLILNKQERFVNLFLPFLVLLATFGFYSLLQTAQKQRLLCSLLLFFTTVSFVFSFVMITQQISFSSVQEEAYFAGGQGIVATTEPVFAAYSDMLFVPLYFDVHQGYDALLSAHADYYVYSDVYACSYCLDSPACAMKKNAIKQNMFARPVLHTGATFTVFEK